MSNKKLRGIPRRLRAIQNWSENITDYFPDAFSPTDLYRNYKIPVHRDLVEGPKSSNEIRRHCAQQMINAIARIQKAKPSQTEARITCLIAMPDMFSSELCIYFDESYFQSFLEETDKAWKVSARINDRLLSEELDLVVPQNFDEIGIAVKLQSIDEEDDWEYVSEHWYFGELS